MVTTEWVSHRYDTSEQIIFQVLAYFELVGAQHSSEEIITHLILKILNERHLTARLRCSLVEALKRQKSPLNRFL